MPTRDEAEAQLQAVERKAAETLWTGSGLLKGLALLVRALSEENERLKLQRDEACEQFDKHVAWASDQQAAAEARAIAAEEALKDTLASLVAAHSLLSRSPKTAAPSNTMFDMMLSDYAASIGRGRAALAQKEGG